MRLSTLGVCLVAGSMSVAAQPESTALAPMQPLEQLAPELNARLIALERAQGVLLGALIKGNGTVNEADVLKSMTRRTSDLASLNTRPDVEADQGFAALGAQAAGIIHEAHRFHREVLAIIGSIEPSQRKAALAEAVRRYKGGRATLADAPKDMGILYDHKYTAFVAPKPPATEPTRTLKYASLTGFTWAAHWYELAAVEPLEVSDMAARARGLATIADRFSRKLSAGAPLDGYPTELPLAPAIAPGLVASSERAAAIVDNLNMMLSVIQDVLVHPAVGDRRAAISEAVTQFIDRPYRCVQVDEWIVVALRHSIFDQGGYALASMSGYERNAFGHGHHYGVKRPPPACDPE